jgi:hypothetical protein
MGAQVAKTRWEDEPIHKTPKGVAIKLDTICYYPNAKKLADRGHGNVVADDVKVPFQDEVEFLEGTSRVLRRAKQIDATRKVGCGANARRCRRA